MTPLRAYVAARIRDLRRRHGLVGISQEELAAGVGVTTNTISRWETGTYQPDIDDLDRLARFFGVPILEFFPKVESAAQEPVNALLRAAKDLSAGDLEELRRYAEYRRARHLLDKERPRAGRKRKEAP